MFASRTRHTAHRITAPAVALVAVWVALLLGPGTVAGQGPKIAPTATLGLSLIEENPAVSLGLGGRTVWGPLVAMGVLDVSVVGWAGGDGRYEWSLFRCRDTVTGRTASSGRCGEPEFRWGGVVDLSVVFAEDSEGLRPLVGAGYRFGDGATGFGALGLVGEFRNGARWYTRLLASRRFIEVHFGFSIR